MVRKTLTAVAAVSLLVASPLAAQEHMWDRQRPDGHAPLGLIGDVTLDEGQWLFTYRYSKDVFEGLRLGNAPATFDDAFDLDFTTIPADLRVEAHEAEVRYGLSNSISVAASIPFFFREMTNLTDEGASFFITDANDIGDVQLRLMYDLFESEGYRANLTLGGSAPTGSIDDTDVTPTSFPQVEQLPFAMQSGSGTFDFIPGMTLQAQNESGTVGAHAEGRIHFGDNDRGYKRGDAFTGTLWASYLVNEWVSASARLLWESWGDVSASDPGTDGNLDLSANPFSTGGYRFTVPFGVNVMLQDGPLAGWRMAVEWHYVASEDLNGIQLAQNDGLFLGFQVGSR